MSGIVISVRAGATYEKSSVTATGQLVHIITDKERSSFGIGGDDDLKRAVEKYFGKRPNDAFLHSPTPWEDLYKRYGWPQTQTVLEPKKAEILEITSEPKIVATQTLTNESNLTASYSSKISEQVTNSVSNTWSSSSQLSFSQMIKYEIGFLGIGGGGETKVGFEQTWGKSETVSKETTVGMETGVTVELKPGESATVELVASSGKMRVRITYEAYLTGDVAVNYYPKYNGHHFHALPIGEVVSSIGSQKLQITEDIEIGFYSNAKVTVRNKATMEKMAFYRADHPHE